MSVQGENRVFILAKNPIYIGKDAICRIYTENNHKHNSEANAKLISAAPELLDALIEAKKVGLFQGESGSNVIKKINNVIKKATE